jgi:DNA-directed RNA polymerase subunit RPC12/RpoP
MEDFILRDFNSDSISNCKLINGKCCRCGEFFSYTAIKKFMANRKLRQDKKDQWITCQKCWHRIQTAEDKVWLDKNSAAQLIAQNLPEQKRANAAGVSKSWDDSRKKTASDFLKNRWITEEGFAEKAMANINWTQQNDDRFSEMIQKTLGVGGLKGIYSGLFYDSALELSYIIWCQEKSIPIKRYDLEPIDYIDELGKERKYFPDFIIYDNTIVEIKGRGIYFKLNYERNILKLEAAKKKFDKYLMIMDQDDCVKQNYNKARKIHHENNKQKKDKI